jgi:hypothetical protein
MTDADVDYVLKEKQLVGSWKSSLQDRKAALLRERAEQNIDGYRTRATLQLRNLAMVGNDIVLVPVNRPPPKKWSEEEEEMEVEEPEKEEPKKRMKRKHRKELSHRSEYKSLFGPKRAAVGSNIPKGEHPVKDLHDAHNFDVDIDFSKLTLPIDLPAVQVSQFGDPHRGPKLCFDLTDFKLRFDLF